MRRPDRGEATAKTIISLSLGGRWSRIRNRTTKARRINQSRYRMTTYVELRLVSGTVVEDPKAVAELPYP